MGKCSYCGGNAQFESHHESDVIFCKCDVCGRYAIGAYDRPRLPNDRIASFLYHNIKRHEEERPTTYTAYLGKEENYNYLQQKYPHYHLTTSDEITAFWQCKFSERVDRILLALARRSKFFGEQMYLSFPEMQSLLFITRFDEHGQELESVDVEMQISEMTNFLVSRDYAKISGDGDGFYVTLLAEGWRRVDELQQQGNDSKDVFVSMSFAPSAKQTREAIRNGIIRAGFSAEFIDEIVHNRQIVPEMFRLIRECRFLVLDISEPNYGAYYEAGYALGLGKEVIITCSAEVFSHKYESEEEKKYERYLKPHFDIAQKQILVWNDHEDLSTKLCEWIKALIR